MPTAHADTAKAGRVPCHLGAWQVILPGVATELIILPTAYRHEIDEAQIRHALATSSTCSRTRATSITIITGSARNYL